MAARARSIVLGYDGSEVSRRALDAAADLVGYGATLAVVGVRQNGARDLSVELEDAREHLLQRHVSAVFAEPPGEPAEAIATAVDMLGADLVVVGGAGAEPDDELGSFVAGVLSQARCDVLVVR